MELLSLLVHLHNIWRKYKLGAAVTTEATKSKIWIICLRKHDCKFECGHWYSHLRYGQENNWSGSLGGKESCPSQTWTFVSLLMQWKKLVLSYKACSATMWWCKASQLETWGFTTIQPSARIDFVSQEQESVLHWLCKESDSEPVKGIMLYSSTTFFF